jgi:lysophospholipase L1-like esterase
MPCNFERMRPHFLRVITGVAIVGIACAGLTACASGTDDRGHARQGTTTTAPTAEPPAATATPAPTPTPYASPDALTPYVAIGDSYAAGMGGGGEQGGCRRGPNAYAVQLSSLSGIPLQRNAACAGATTADVQRTQLGALSKTTRLVTLSVGGNDLNVAALATSCSSGATSDCQKKFRAAITLMKVLPDRLAATYRAVAKAAPNARIIVTGYPILFKAPATDSPTFATIAVIDAATFTLDDTIRKAVARQKKAGLPIEYVGVDFTLHGIGASDSWVNASGIDAFHPTAAGYAEYARAVLTALNAARSE